MSAPYPASMAAHGPARRLELYLDELVAQLRLLPLESAARPALIRRIVEVEAEIDARTPL